MIPAIAHFIWLGSQFWWVNVLAIRSASLRGGFERVILHHDSELAGTRWWPELEVLPNFEARRLDLAALFRRASPTRGDELAALHDELVQPAARANLIRAAVLAAEGGCYLDIDTVTLRSLAPLHAEGGVFCGVEHVCWTGEIKHAGSLAAKARAHALAALREVHGVVPGGWRRFRGIAHLYLEAANNAVLAGEAGHPFIADLLVRMLDMPERARLRRYALGTHLLQRCVAAYSGDDLRVYPPAVFYPFGPVISQHWFARTPDAARVLDEVIGPDARVIHWYASVKTKRLLPRIDPDYVRRHAETQLLSALALPFVGES